MKNKPLKDWEVEFDELYEEGSLGSFKGELEPHFTKDFIRRLLAQTKSQIVEQILKIIDDMTEPGRGISGDRLIEEINKL